MSQDEPNHVTFETTDRFNSALKLHGYMLGHHWRDGLIIGPDAGVRFNWRIGRFVKSYLQWIDWKDDLCYVQAQGYWVLDNWRLFVYTGQNRYRELALQCSDRLIERQRADGAWDYPNPEWNGRVATAECTWGCLGLIQSYRHSGLQQYLDAVLKWHNFLINQVGFQQVGPELAINYFAEHARPRVPNNTAFVLRFFAELADVTGDLDYVRFCPSMVLFLKNAQTPAGELPYSVMVPGAQKGRDHFLCAHYNAFECLDLIRYYELTGDKLVLPVVTGILRFLRASLGEDGHVRYDCNSGTSRQMVFHSAAVGAAFEMATHLGVSSDREYAQRAFAYVIRQQRDDGSFSCSRGDYGLLRDDRAYPRVQGYILCHLLTNTQMPVAEAA